MAFVIDDRVQQQPTVGGTGNIVLAGVGATPGFRRFGDVMAVGDTTWAFAYDPTSQLWGVYLVTYAAGDQLQRTTRLASSTGAEIDFPGNACQVAMTIPAAFVAEMLAQGPGTPVSFGTVSFGAGSVAQDGTITVTLAQPYAAHVTELVFDNGSGGGSTTVAVKNGGTSVTGLSAVVVNSSGSAAASGLNAVPAGGAVALVLSATTGTISDGGALTLNGTRD